MNTVGLKGNLTRDPELKDIGSGDNATQVANFTVAVNRKFRRANGDKDQETTYVDCEVWDTAAATLAQYCSKGDPILVEGALKLDSWTADDGSKRSKLKVRVSRFERLYRGQPQVEETAAVADSEATPAPLDGDPEIPF